MHMSHQYDNYNINIKVTLKLYPSKNQIDI
jgi:hypothetical protein